MSLVTKPPVLDDTFAGKMDALIAAVGGSGCVLTVTVNREDGVAVESGVTVTIETEVSGQSETKTVAYSGQPISVSIPRNASYRVSASGTIGGYVTPAAAFGVALISTSVVLTYQAAKRYGYKREKAESNCADRITYLFDAVGMTPAGMTYGSNHVGTFDYGSWENFINQVARPVMLNTDGSIAYELDHDDQTKKIDGSHSEIHDITVDANAMTEFGSAFKWVKRYEDEDYEYVVFSNTQYDSDYHAYAHTGDDGNVKEAFYIGMWEGPVVSNKLRSIADGSAVSNTITMEVAITRAKANGTGHNIVPKSRWDYVADLLTLISKTDNSQVAFGNGRQEMGSSANNRGSTSELRTVGPFYGNNDNTHPVKVFWLVHWWGNVWQWLAGLVNYEGDLKYRNYGPYCDTPVSDPDYSTYVSTGLDAPQEGGGFQSETHMGDYGYLWTKTEGSASTYVPDRGNANNEQVSLPFVGANWNDGAGMAGSRALGVTNLASTSAATHGARLSYIPD